MNLRISAFAVLALTLMTSNAYAYIDPGTGSIVTTAIIGFFAMIAYTARGWFYRLQDRLGMGRPRKRDPKAKK